MWMHESKNFCVLSGTACIVLRFRRSLKYHVRKHDGEVDFNGWKANLLRQTQICTVIRSALDPMPVQLSHVDSLSDHAGREERQVAPESIKQVGLAFAKRKPGLKSVCFVVASVSVYMLACTYLTDIKNIHLRLKQPPLIASKAQKHDDVPPICPTIFLQPYAPRPFTQLRHLSCLFKSQRRFLSLPSGSTPASV